MSDKREYAGNLGANFIGKSVEVTYTHGNIQSTVRDEIVKITHSTEGVRLFFKGTRWTPNTIAMSLGGPPDVGLLVPTNAYVHIKEG